MDVLTLALITLAAATISGAIGMGGGSILVAVMASMLSPAQVVPIHGVVQLLSNSSRGLLLVRHVVWSLIALYVPLQIVGVLVAVELYRGSELTWFRPIVGGFILAAVLWDIFRPKRLSVPRWIFALAGFGGGLLTILVGVTGPYLSSFFLRDDLKKEQIVATKATIQTIGHLAKIPAFLVLGFDYGAHLTLLIPLVLAALIGTWIGTRLLGRMRNDQFRWAFRGILGLVAARLLIQSIF